MGGMTRIGYGQCPVCYSPEGEAWEDEEGNLVCGICGWANPVDYWYLTEADLDIMWKDHREINEEDY